MQVPWRSQVLDSARGVLITLTNGSNYNLVLRGNSLASGTWVGAPAETVASGATVQFGALASSWLAPSCEGVLEYETMGMGLATIVFSNPLININFKADSVGFNATAPAQIKGKSERKSHNKGWLLEIKVMVGSSDVLQGSSSNAPTIPSRKKRQSIMSKEETPWGEKMTGWQRGMFVTLINNTDCALLLESNELGEGSSWARKPSQTVVGMARDTFASFSRGVLGTSGTITWCIQGSEKRVLLIWSNPHFGPIIKDANGPDQFNVVCKSTVDRNCSGVVLIVSRKTGAPLLLNDEVEDMEWASAVSASGLKTTDVDRDASVRLLSLACSLLPLPLTSNLGDPLRRAQLLAETLRNSPYMVICLQEVFWGQARELIRAAVATSFPHIIDRAGKEAYGVGVSAGLFVASKSPIEWSQFFPFEEGIGSDSLAHKGVMMIKIQKHNMYIAVTDVQSDPDGSIPWKLQGNSKVRAAQVRNGQMQMIGRMMNQIITEREKRPEECALVLTGTLHVSAERRVRHEQEQWATSTLIPHLADLINSGKVPVVYASELLQELKSRGFQMRFLAKLRESTTDRRSRSLLLIVMVARVLQQELWQTMRAEVFASKADEQNRYVELGLRYLEAICDYKRPNTGGAEAHAEGKSMSQSLDRLERSSEKSEENLSSSAANGGNEKAQGADGLGTSKGGDTEDMSSSGGAGTKKPKLKLMEDIWQQDLVRLLTQNFGTGSLGGANECYASFLRAEIQWFQLLRYMQEILGIILGSEVEIDLLKNGPRELEYPNDVEHASIGMTEAMGSEDWESDQKLQIERTVEFKNMVKLLAEPRDAYREANPQNFGADYSPRTSARRSLNEEEGRTHHLLLFDQLPNKPSQKLLSLAPASCSRIALMGDSGALTDYLTVTPGVETILVPSMDDFIVM